MKIKLKVNGKEKSVEIEPNTLLVDLIRNQLGLTGTHVGCDTSQCGACVVDLNGKSIKSCTVLAASADDGELTTIEGLADGDTLSRLQEAFRNCHGLQCGFCTPGMVMSCRDLLKNNPNPCEREVREWLEGNICRCTGYHNIVKAVMEAV